ATSYNYYGTDYDSDCGGGFGHQAFWVQARDHRGNMAVSAMVTDRVTVLDETGNDDTNEAPHWAVTRAGPRANEKCTSANEGSTTFSTTKGATITYTGSTNTGFAGTVNHPGRTIAIVAPKGPDHGVMRVSVDGGRAVSVNTYAATAADRIIVWQKS